ncbi:MAG: AMP nucleosidase, partial [Pseudomonadota bacterium]
MNMAQEVRVRTPDIPQPESFTDARKAVERLQELYNTAVKFLSENFSEALMNGQPETRVRAFYPEIRLTTTTYAKTDTRLSFGHVAEPGVYAT